MVGQMVYRWVVLMDSCSVDWSANLWVDDLVVRLENWTAAMTVEQKVMHLAGN